MSTNENLRRLSEWIDDSPINVEQSEEARLWGRTAKVAEEAGEVISAHGRGSRRSTIQLDIETTTAIVNYKCPVPLFNTGAQAAEHGLAELAEPGEKAARTISKLVRKGLAQ